MRRIMGAVLIVAAMACAGTAAEDESLLVASDRPLGVASMFWRGCEWEEVATVETRGDGWSMTYAIDSHGCPVGVGGSWPGFQWDAEAQACVMDLTVTGGVEEFRSLILRVRGPRGEVCGEWLVSEHVNGAE